MKNLTTLQNITAHGRHREYSGREWKKFFILSFLIVIFNIHNGFTQTYTNEYSATDLETIFSYGVITSNINYSIRTELNAKNIRLFHDSLGNKEFDAQQLPIRETLKNIRRACEEFCVNGRC